MEFLFLRFFERRSSCLGGLSTPSTPERVRYFLDQAHRAQGVGARVAAMAMYRAALEHLLLEQGFKTGMLGSKIGELQGRIKAGTAEKWAKDLDPKFLNVIKNLGNWSMHPDESGKFAPSTVVTADVFAAVKATFTHLLFAVYELPHREAERLETLEKALGGDGSAKWPGRRKGVCKSGIVASTSVCWREQE